MKYAFFLLLVTTLAGCVTGKTKAIIPSLESKPRVQINKQAPATPTPTSETTAK